MQGLPWPPLLCLAVPGRDWSAQWDWNSILCWTPHSMDSSETLYQEVQRKTTQIPEATMSQHPGKGPSLNMLQSESEVLPARPVASHPFHPSSCYPHVTSHSALKPSILPERTLLEEIIQETRSRSQGLSDLGGPSTSRLPWSLSL